MTETSVTYEYKPTKSLTVQSRTVDGQKFVAGFAQHILPTGFHKIRHYGWMTSGQTRQAKPVNPPPSGRQAMDTIQSLLTGEIETYLKCDRYRSELTLNLTAFSMLSSQSTSQKLTFQHRRIGNSSPLPTINKLAQRQKMTGTSDCGERNAQVNL